MEAAIRATAAAASRTGTGGRARGGKIVGGVATSTRARAGVATPQVRDTSEVGGGIGVLLQKGKGGPTGKEYFQIMRTKRPLTTTQKHIQGLSSGLLCSWHDDSLWYEASMDTTSWSPSSSRSPYDAWVCYGEKFKKINK